MNYEMRSAAQLVNQVKKDRELQRKIKANPVEALEDISSDILQKPPAYLNDKWLYRMAIGALALVVVGVVVGAFVLSGIDKDIPDVIVAIGSAAIGGLVALFAPSPLAQS